MSMRFLWSAPLLVCCLGLVAFSNGSVQAQDKPPPALIPRIEIEAELFRTLRLVINQGADLYNSGDWSGCYRLYEGSLIAVRPLLDNRPELQKEIDAAIVNAARTPQVGDRAFVLRKALDRVRADIDPKVAVIPKIDMKVEVVGNPTKKLTLWDRLGGEPGVSRVVDAFLATSLADPKVNFFRQTDYRPDEKQLAALKRKMIEYFSAMTGGPFDYKGINLKEAHKGMGITNVEFDILALHLQTALVKQGVHPRDIELVMDLVASTRKDIVLPAAPPVPSVPSKKPEDRPDDDLEPIEKLPVEKK